MGLSILGSPCLSFAETPATLLKEIVRNASKKRVYTPAHWAQHAEWRELFCRTLRGEYSPELRSAWRRTGFNLSALVIDGQLFTQVHELPDAERGQGYYLFRPVSKSQPLALQIPHSFKDLRTRRLGCQLMLESQAAMASWNTVPRSFGERKAEGGGRRSEAGDDKPVTIVDADMSHTRISAFNACMEAFTETYSSGVVVQLHGFSSGKRKSETGKSSQLILSDSSRFPGPLMLDRRDCLRTYYGGTVSLFPVDVVELGGTRNVQAACLRSVDAHTFLHVEINEGMRKSLVQNFEDRKVLLQCLMRSLP